MFSVTFLSLLTILTILTTSVLSLPHAHPSPITTIAKRGLAPGYLSTALLLQPVGQSTLCLGTTTEPANDVYLYLIPCDTTTTWWGAWQITQGENQVISLSGTNFCLDAGLNPHNGGPSKLYTCYPGVSQQNWYYTPDLHIAITGGTQCLDAAGGGCGLGGCAPGTEACGTTNTQQWATAPLPTTPPPPSTGLQINWNGNSSRCLTPSVRGPSDGTTLFEGDCLHKSDAFSQLQLFDIQRGSGQVKLHGTNLCLDAGSNPGNGIVAKLWTCYPGLFQQTWYYTDDNHIAITGGTQCLDLKAEDGFTVQTWTCSGNDKQQLWTTGTQT